MRLYHSHLFKNLLIGLCLLQVLIAAGCEAPQATQALISVTVTADGGTKTIQLPAGSTVQAVLDAAAKAGADLNYIDGCVGEPEPPTEPPGEE